MRKTSVLRIAAAVFLGTVAGSAPVLAMPSRACVSAHIDSPFRLPDGVLRPAGVLTLCNTRQFSPVATLHKVLVDRRPVGMFLSRRRNAEGVFGLPEIFFERDGAGTLELLGYVLPTRGPTVAYRLKRAQPAAVLGESVARVVVPLIEPQR
jgi:hypothetical protein